MSFPTLKMAVGPLPPAAAPKGSKVKEPTLLKRAALPLQVRNEEQKPHRIETITTRVSRRDMALGLTAATLTGLNIFRPEPVEARVIKPETRKKIMEKLEWLREKAGLSKQKSENGENTTSPPKPLVKEKELPLPKLPNLQKSADKSVVEATLQR